VSTAIGLGRVAFQMFAVVVVIRVSATSHR
jgi:hypothetical protein